MKNKPINNIHELRLRLAEMKYSKLEKERKIKSDFQALGASVMPSKLAESAIGFMTGKSGFAKTPYYRLLQLGIAFSIEKWLFKSKSKTFQSTVILVIQGITAALLQLKGDDLIKKIKQFTENLNFRSTTEKKKSRFEEDEDYLGI